jgi:deazaflavin-dependent oxidoreductase (nitroreductase family)
MRPKRITDHKSARRLECASRQGRRPGTCVGRDRRRPAQMYSQRVTVKVPPKGSRGVPFPHFLMAFGNRWVLRQFRRHEMRTAGGIPGLLLETVGAKSGQSRKAVLGYLEEGAGSWLVIASTAGAAYHPAWLYNLAKQPEATIEFEDGRRIPVRAETLEGQELEAAWARIATDAPEYAAYRSKTDRDIPVLRLRQR